MIAFTIALLRLLLLYVMNWTTGPPENLETCPPLDHPAVMAIPVLAVLYMMLAVSVFLKLGSKRHVPSIQSLLVADQRSRVGGVPDLASPATSAASLPLIVSERCAV